MLSLPKIFFQITNGVVIGESENYLLTVHMKDILYLLTTYSDNLMKSFLLQTSYSMEVPFERPNSQQIPKCFLHNQDWAIAIFTTVALVQPATRIVLLSSLLSGLALEN